MTAGALTLLEEAAKRIAEAARLAPEVHAELDGALRMLGRAEGYLGCAVGLTAPLPCGKRGGE